MAVTTQLTNNFRKGLLQAAYDFDTGIQTINMALYNGSTHTANTTQYTSTNECPGTGGYTQTGLDMGDVDTGAPQVDTAQNVAFLDWATNPSWTTSTITATDCLIYRTGGTVPIAEASIYIGDFGGSKSSSSGTFSVVLPAGAYNTAVIRLA